MRRRMYYQETQKRRNEQNAAPLNRYGTESLRRRWRALPPCSADAVVRNAALEREMNVIKGVVTTGAPKTYHNDDVRLLLQYSQQQAQTEGRLPPRSFPMTEKMTEAHKQLCHFSSASPICPVKTDGG